MGSIRRKGVRFTSYPNDHLPRHVHAFVGEVQIIIELLENGADLANRKDSLQPFNGKRSDVRKALQVATEYFEELIALWEKRNG